jgi:hypothetical protein
MGGTFCSADYHRDHPDQSPCIARQPERIVRTTLRPADSEDDEDDKGGALPANSLFEFFHLGGDEVQYPCWNASEAIRRWMKLPEHRDIGNLRQLEQYFWRRVRSMVQANRSQLRFRQLTPAAATNKRSTGTSPDEDRIANANANANANVDVHTRLVFWEEVLERVGVAHNAGTEKQSAGAGAGIATAGGGLDFFDGGVDNRDRPFLLPRTGPTDEEGGDVLEVWSNRSLAKQALSLGLDVILSEGWYLDRQVPVRKPCIEHVPTKPQKQNQLSTKSMKG